VVSCRVMWLNLNNYNALKWLTIREREFQMLQRCHRHGHILLMLFFDSVEDLFFCWRFFAFLSFDNDCLFFGVYLHFFVHGMQSQFLHI